MPKWIGSLLCRLGRHDWMEDHRAPHVYLYRRHCGRCGARQVKTVDPAAPWVDVE